jgi:GTP cyclohydrolase II/3,4-dihydroxy 2-butanone 4-phosphate synthase/GTP cyclohydrolase II
MISIADLRTWREQTERRVTRTGQSSLPTEVGDFGAIAYQSPGDGIEHLVLVKGDVAAADAPLVRVHSECLTGDLAGSLRCDCGAQFRSALSAIADAGSGIMIYLRGHEGRGIGLGHKLRAYELQQWMGLDTVDANLQLGLPIDSRDYGAACDILDDLGVRSVRLLTNNPDKVQALADRGITVTERVAHEPMAGPHSWSYLTTKRDRMGHLLQKLR